MVKEDRERNPTIRLRSSLPHLQRRVYNSKLVDSRMGPTAFKSWSRSEKDRAVCHKRPRPHHH
jgi:hypothetical protein